MMTSPASASQESMTTTLSGSAEVPGPGSPDGTGQAMRAHLFLEALAVDYAVHLVIAQLVPFTVPTATARAPPRVLCCADPA